MGLIEHRKLASDHSRGSSHQSIYSKGMAYLETYRGTEKSLLDFGAGQGEFISQVFSTGNFRSLVAVDLMPKPNDVDKEIQWIQGDLNENVALESGSIDVVTALEVIEHLENPRHMFREIYRLLKPGGEALISTPNNESYRAVLSYVVRGHFVDFTDSSYPAHITPLNRKDLLRSSQEAGFRLKGWDFTNYGAVPGVTALSWQTLTLGLAKGLRYSDNLFLQVQKP